MGEGFACEIAAVQFTAEFGDQKLVKNYMAKFISEGPTASIVREVIMKDFYGVLFEIHILKLGPTA